jgi:hypothetical protein
VLLLLEIDISDPANNDLLVDAPGELSQSSQSSTLKTVASSPGTEILEISVASSPGMDNLEFSSSGPRLFFFLFFFD